jgi:two-component system, sporulation sensor kinase E
MNDTDSGSHNRAEPDNERPLKAAIVGGGKGCVSILKMVEKKTLRDFRMRIVAVADTCPDAPGVLYARRLGVPRVTRHYRDLYEIPGLDLIIELTGLPEVAADIERTRPGRVHLIDHVGARLFWELHQAGGAVDQHRTEMRQRVELEREQHAQILNSIPDEILLLDRDMLIQDANSSFLENNSLTLDSVRGKQCYDVESRMRGGCRVATEDCPFFTVMKEGVPKSLVRKSFDEHGRAHYISIVGAPWRDREGNVVGMIEITRDITNRVRLEEVLKATEIRLQRFMDLAPQVTSIKDLSGRYIDVNPSACKLFGKAESEILGRTDRELFSREDAEKLMAGDNAARRRRKSISFDMELEMGGHKVYLSTVKFPIMDKEGNPTAVCGIAKDITAQKEAEIQLRVTREYLQNVIDNSPVLIITSNLEGRIASFNRAAEESLGYTAEEAIGLPSESFYMNSAVRERLIRRITEGDVVRDFSTELRRKDGKPVQVSLSLSRLKDSSGRMIGTVGMCKDISHRKALMGQIMQSERLAAVGRLASGVAHEINNPLAIISEIAGYLNDLLEAGPGTCGVDFMEELRSGLPKVLTHVKRGRAITRRLLSFARKSEARVKVANVNSCLEEIMPFLGKEAHLANVKIHGDYQPDLARVAIEEMQLQEILINLITNAIHALAGREEGNVWLSTREEEGKVVVSVRDDGPGVDDSVRDRLFDPFVTTKPTGLGTGLGLSICYGIVKRHDGEIRVLSEPGQGATFMVVLPAHTALRSAVQDEEL